jgi:hypothetical protein
MATNIVAAPLKVTMSMEVNLGGIRRDVKWENTFAGIKYISNEVIPIGTAEKTIITFSTAGAGATFDEDDVRFVGIYNRDDTNFVQIIIADENTAESAWKLEADHFMIIPTSDEGVVNMHDAQINPLSVTFGDLTSITALANTAECDIETFVAIV